MASNIFGKAFFTKSKYGSGLTEAEETDTAEDQQGSKRTAAHISLEVQPLRGAVSISPCLVTPEPL